MNKAEELKQKADYCDKQTYNKIIKMLSNTADEGKYSYDIYAEDILFSDVEKLKCDGFEVVFYNGEDFDYYNVSWK